MQSLGGWLAARAGSVNPVARKDVLEFSRGRWFLWLSAGAALALSLLVIGAWPDYAPSKEAMEEGADEAFASAMRWQAALLALFLLFQADDAIRRERDGGTMEMLHVSPLSARDIVQGKCLAMLAEAGYLLAIGLPAVSSLYLLGEIPLEGLVREHLLLAAWAAVLAASFLRAAMLSGRGRALYAVTAPMMLLSASSLGSLIFIFAATVSESTPLALASLALSAWAVRRVLRISAVRLARVA